MSAEDRSKATSSFKRAIKTSFPMTSVRLLLQRATDKLDSIKLSPKAVERNAETPELEQGSTLRVERNKTRGTVDRFNPEIRSKPTASTSATAHRPYQYQPLASGDSNHWIRTLEILPGAATDPIQISLTHRSLSQISDCIAVSYEWGELVRSHAVFCEGRTLLVTTNLLTFLKQFRATPASKPLWIDALCVNQDDLAERTQQVALMRVIYQEAASVMAWLGEARRVTEDSIKIILRMARINDSLGNSGAGVDVFRLPSDIPHGAELEALTRDRSWAGAADVLCSTSYFQRLWIIQEIVLASHLLFVCGSYQIDLESFRSAVALVCSCRFLNDAATYKYGYDITNLLTASLILAHRDAIKDGRWQFNSLVHTFSDSQCSDPRDRIFGLVSLLPVSLQDPLLVADYTKSVEKVFQDATEYVLVQEQSTAPLRFVDTALAFRNPDVPSWVPYYNERDSVIVTAPSFNQSVLEGDPQMMVHNGILTIHGLIVDSISSSSKNFVTDGIAAELLSFVRNVAASCAEIQLTLLSGLWQALVSYEPDRDDGPRLERGFFDCISVLPEFDYLLSNSDFSPPNPGDESSNGDSLTVSADALYEAVSYRMIGLDLTLGRNVFRSSSGLYGYGPAGRNDVNASAVQPGDCIVAFPFERHPMILRSCEDGMYTLIGVCYIACLEGLPWLKDGHIPTTIPIRIR